MVEPTPSAAWVRRPAVAGQFYPADPVALRRAVDSLLDGAGAARQPAASAPKAIIAPHAGYVYSGPVAARAYRALAGRRDRVRRVLLAGPAHRVALAGVGVPSAAAFATPLGSVPVDAEGREIALGIAGVAIDDAAHAEEHSLEVHLPFLQLVLSDFTVLPLVVGRGGAPVLTAVFDALWDGDETIIVVSTDLSHYHDDVTAKTLDRRTAEAIVDGRAGDIGPYDACGAGPVQGLLAAAGDHGLTTTLLDLRTSGDTAGSRDRVVGYGAFALTPSA